MCFIKKVEFSAQPVIITCERRCYSYNTNFFFGNQQFQLFNSNHNMLPNLDFNLSYLMGHLTNNLSSLLQKISSNNLKIIESMSTLNQNEQYLQEAALQLQEKLIKQGNLCLTLAKRQPHCQLNQIPFFTNQPIISKIFGSKQYKYKLNLSQSFPKIIYKERNLNIAVKLANPNTQSLHNANLIHLCIGVCNNLGQWIVEESGDFFIQGKIEIDLYHGEAEFKKISPKDVSRHFNGGVVNLVIYPKKSLINFTGQITKYQKIIDSDFIEPLVIKDVIIKAKKKSKHY